MKLNQKITDALINRIITNAQTARSFLHLFKIFILWLQFFQHYSENGFDVVIVMEIFYSNIFDIVDDFEGI